MMDMGKFKVGQKVWMRREDGWRKQVEVAVVGGEPYNYIIVDTSEAFGTDLGDLCFYGDLDGKQYCGPFEPIGRWELESWT